MMNNDRLPLERLNIPTSLPDSASNAAAQERFSDRELTAIRNGFANRLRQAFDHANNAEIARRCKTTDTTIKTYTDGDRLPIPEMLLQISRVTGVNIHWLLTGEGTRRTAFGNLFTEEEEETISELARKKNVSFNELVRLLTVGGAEFLKTLTLSNQR